MQTQERYTPVEGDTGSFLRATVTYEDGYDSGNVLSATASGPVEARPAANTAPQFGALTTTRSVAENATGSVGEAVTANDVEDLGQLTYTLTVQCCLR